MAQAGSTESKTIKSDPTPRRGDALDQLLLEHNAVCLTLDTIVFLVWNFKVAVVQMDVIYYPLHRSLTDCCVVFVLCCVVFVLCCVALRS